jgi:hypothetical protein
MIPIVPGSASECSLLGGFADGDSIAVLVARARMMVVVKVVDTRVNTCTRVRASPDMVTLVVDLPKTVVSASTVWLGW